MDLYYIYNIKLLYLLFVIIYMCFITICKLIILFSMCLRAQKVVPVLIVILSLSLCPFLRPLRENFVSSGGKNFFLGGEKKWQNEGAKPPFFD